MEVKSKGKDFSLKGKHSFLLESTPFLKGDNTRKRGTLPQKRKTTWCHK